MDNIIETLKNLSEEQKSALRALLSEKKEEPKKEVKPPAKAKSGNVYFFKDKKTGKIFFVNQRSASKLYWSFRGYYDYLFRSDGSAWKENRDKGVSVSEAQDAEYKYAQQINDTSPPPDSRDTKLGRGNIFSIERSLNNITQLDKDE